MAEVGVGIMVFLIGYAFGWGRAHSVIAEECRRLGGFYVGRSVFRCTEIKEEDHG